MKNDAYTFAAEVDRLIINLTNEEFHCRIGRSKTLREEVYPLSRLALFLKRPGLNVEVEAYENSLRADGHIQVTGFYEQEIEVQITFAGYGYDDALRSQLLVSDGFAPCAGEIRREKKGTKIIATVAAVDHDEHINRISAAVLEVFRKKVLKPYAAGTWLLIVFEERQLSGRSAWNALFNSISEAGGLTASQFSSIYLFNGATNEIHKAA